MSECVPTNCGTPANNKSLNYTYDLAGNMLTSTDGGGVTSTYTYSLADEPTSLTSSKSDSSDPPNIVSTVVNGPYGPQSYEIGSGLYNVYKYDVLGRIAGGWLCDGSYSSNCSSGTTVYNYANSWSSAQLTASQDSVLGQSATYGYDEFNRLISRTITSGTVQNLAWNYDRYGNRWNQTLTAGSGSVPQPSVSFTAGPTHLNRYMRPGVGGIGMGYGEPLAVFFPSDGPSRGADTRAPAGRDPINRHCGSIERGRELE